MFDELSFMTIFFRLFNCAVLAAVFAYFFKHTIKSSLEEKITQKEALLKGLEEQGYMLEGKEHDLAHRSDTQRIKTEHLQERLQEWATAIESHHNRKKEEAARQREASIKRINAQNEQMQQAYLVKQMKPVMVAQVRSQLTQQFTDVKKGNDFLAQMINKMQEKPA